MDNSQDSRHLFSGRVALQQRVIPSYRAPFFDLLAESCEGGLSVFAGYPLSVEGISVASSLKSANYQRAKNYHFSNPSTKYYLCWQRGILEWLHHWNPDALIVEGNPRYLSNRLAIQWMKERGRPVVGWGLGAPPIFGYFSKLRIRNRQSYLNQLDGIVAYSQGGAEEYREMGFSAERVFTATNSVMSRPEHALPPRREKFSDRPVVLFVGRLQARKRLDILLHACASLPGDLQPLLIVVGDGPARTDFERLAKSVYSNVKFVGAKYGDETKEYFLKADLFTLPGTGGLAVQQAMSYGLPVIVAQGDGTQDDLVRPKNGWQVPPGDQNAFTHTFADALSDVGRLRIMGADSFRIVREEANLEQMVSTFVEALTTFQP